MSIVTQLNDLFQYIEQHLQTPITLEQLAHTANLSVYQLIRLFDRFIGMTPIAYIRARRLARSLPQLLSGETILSVALDWGFEYEQSYIRAFQDSYGITPGRFRRQGSSVEIVDVPNLERFTVSADGIVGNARLLVRPAFAVEGELKRYHYLDNLLWGKSLLEGVEHCTSAVYSAVCRSLSPGAFEQLYLVQATEPRSNPVQWQFPCGQWASFHYFGLHPLNAAGAARIRILMSLVIGNWFADNDIYWDGNFTETVDLQKCSESLCELTFCCFTNPL